jgi:ABC-2 type transport system ATP-binding protein
MMLPRSVGDETGRRGVMEPPSSVLLAAHDLHRAYGRRHVLRGVSFTVAPGTLVGIVGENGAGKSTLLRILAGELAANHGTVTCRGAIGYCPQIPILNEALTVAQHLTYFAAAYGVTDRTYTQSLVTTLAYEQYRDARVGALSGGTRQKLNLTVALMHRPAVLLLDEPYQGFDWETYLRFWDLVAELRSGGRAVLVISHLLFEQRRFDRLYQLADGRIEDVRPEEESP